MLERTPPGDPVPGRFRRVRMDDGRCLHPEVAELDSAPLRLTKVAAAATGAQLWRCAICANWFVRLDKQDELLDVMTAPGADAFLRHFAGWITAEAARRSVPADEVRDAVLGPRDAPPRMVVRPPPPPEAVERASRVALKLAELGVMTSFTKPDLEELARVVTEVGPWSLPALLASLPDEILARRRVIAPARAIGTVDPWDIAERVNEDTHEGDVSFVLVPAGDAGDLLPIAKEHLPALAMWDALRGEDRRRLARLAPRKK